jgi:choice-of-anchor B domain-containing protein
MLIGALALALTLAAAGTVFAERPDRPNAGEPLGGVAANGGDPAGGPGGIVAGPHETPPPPPDGEPTAMSHRHCEDGFAGPYPCRNVDLLSLVPRSAVGAGPVENLNDVWGWTDPETGREYALVGREAGVSFVDVTDPEHPVLVGSLATRTFASAWRDIKTYRNHAYIVADGSPGHGVQVFDLTRLRGASAAPRAFQATAEYIGPGFGLSLGFSLGSSHNIAIDEETGFAYVVGSNTCSGGLHMIDLSNPARPVFAGCFSADGYTHDVQCTVYRGPDGRYAGREICFAANEDTLTVVDVTDKGRPQMVSRTGYAGAGYTHQAWLTEDHRYLLLDDELDELDFGHGTRTYVWDVQSLGAPRMIGAHTAASPATDHNQYVRGGFTYQANYRSGLRILDLDHVAQGELEEVAYFDVDPSSDAPGFAGAWSVYPFFDSGTVVVTGIGTGLFVLRAFAGAHQDHETPTAAPTPAAGPTPPPPLANEPPPRLEDGPRPGRPDFM